MVDMDLMLTCEQFGIRPTVESRRLTASDRFPPQPCQVLSGKRNVAGINYMRKTTGTGARGQADRIEKFLGTLGIATPTGTMKHSALTPPEGLCAAGGDSRHHIDGHRNGRHRDRDGSTW
jgi:hypothetical protein